jgi:hypothetical protein
MTRKRAPKRAIARKKAWSTLIEPHLGAITRA